ncbi:hypothetical protein [Maliponia aquimaris]|uniref:hypothetical protein n=1 Tax=Maliponia aquimaris TaxID=1673631 RepID=UPI000B8B4538|nr:hypothetical protein [Maliponia aquimaris]
MSLAFVPVASSAATLNNPFDIVVNFVGGLTASQQAVFTGAEAFWETMILGNRYDLSFGPLTIDAQGIPIDGVGNVLGSAGPSTAIRTIGAPQDYAYVTSGIMSFDTADLAALESDGSLFDVIVHEMAHVIGFGTMWNPAVYGAVFAGTQNVYTDGTGQYTGAFGLAAYNAEFGLSASYVPVELGGGPGTADAHWDELTFAGGERDIMTGFLDSVSPLADAPFAASTLSATTIASFADIGYITSVTDPQYVVSPVPLPASLAYVLIGLAGLGGLRLRKSRKA